ncbi:23S rRNA (cytidine1920-2'-O)/16S rRNA (cytidine1409-2'-O)-methyltransferase [Natronincola peptidivorans]|uniref:23S rRNA (Cytidine1920-2'-O)/16S rRNA (Cytidine1409-2'-O)-methyltransferase n=1 Tax=Natronincola peptidivorans TaxID=426128 RepID=A0A1H9YNS1_9FIRM|nr:TlyA family RNA methyltransferase [Natronincola peptidivorans]SES70688.1 23S rRNA (cytidine1920-2'-O)/16S rRNA (cytidine1409-2'-O)-methyltransferase [Natronincola peptidivorans]
MEKIRIDTFLVEHGYFNTREKARRTIMAGLVFVDNQKIDKPGTKIKRDSEILVKGNPIPYVSRGGLKLEKAIKEFNISLNNKICFDIGASTGGFTDCMLQNNAKMVYAIDVGYGQLDWKLRQDPRVVVMERTNIRYVESKDIEELGDFASIDVSFISLRLVLPVMKKLLKPSSNIVALIKPQFEAGREKVGKKGVVKDIATHKEVVKDILTFTKSLDLKIIGFSYSPIKGPEGNIEYLLYISDKSNDSIEITEDNVNRIIEVSHEELN